MDGFLMAEQIISGGIGAPGFAGLNLQDSSVQLNTGFALEAFNCVIDKYGRIGARKGWDNVNTTAVSAGPFRSIFELVKADGNVVLSAANSHIYEGTTTLTQKTICGTNFHTGTFTRSGTVLTVTSSSHGYSVGQQVYLNNTDHTGEYTVVTVPSSSTFTVTVTNSGATSGSINTVNVLSYTISDDNWQFVGMSLGTGLSASAHAIAVQESHVPLVFHKLGTSSHSHTDGYHFQRLGDVGNVPSGYTVDTFQPSCALSAFGRLWVAGTSTLDTQTIYFSDLQNPSEWLSGTSGRLDISTVIPTGDPIVALAQHNNFLIIFCKKNIVIYSNPMVPAELKLEDTIKGIGCIARDSVASVAGTDLLFLSDTGVQSLGRIVNEKSLPFRDISKNVRDELMLAVNSEEAKNIKGVYYGSDAFYLLALPSTKFTYCFDTRGVLENGAAKTTIWKDINPTAFAITSTRQLYLGEKGYIGRYTGYSDNGTSYRWSYYTNYFDFDKPNSLKILKKIGFVAIGGGTQTVSVKWSFDYSDNSFGGTVSLNPNVVYEYGTAEYGIAEYANGISLDTKKFNASGSGRVLQLGFEAEIDGYPLSIQKVDFMLKEGKQV
jgi:hypothetical protein